MSGLGFGHADYRGHKRLACVQISFFVDRLTEELIDAFVDGDRLIDLRIRTSGVGSDIDQIFCLLINGHPLADFSG